ncbi:MAG: VanZ family protein [Lachnospiraceae bacterium]|nr:VanZ family protein [Lachnospiraceae bacterium]
MECTKNEKKKKVVIILTHIFFMLYMLVLLRITVFRSTLSFDHLFIKGNVNLTFFESYIALLQERDWWNLTYLFVGNIIWFLPLGIYLSWQGKIKKAWQITLFGLVVSFIIESLQFVFGTGVSDVDDLILNAFGTWCGVMLWKLVVTICDNLKNK